jgi:hypothetical protein
MLRREKVFESAVRADAIQRLVILEHRVAGISIVGGLLHTFDCVFRAACKRECTPPKK